MKIWYQCCDDKQYKIEARKKPEAHFRSQGGGQICSRDTWTAPNTMAQTI